MKIKHLMKLSLIPILLTSCQSNVYIDPTEFLLSGQAKDEINIFDKNNKLPSKYIRSDLANTLFQDAIATFTKEKNSIFSPTSAFLSYISGAMASNNADVMYETYSQSEETLIDTYSFMYSLLNSDILDDNNKVATKFRTTGAYFEVGDDTLINQDNIDYFLNTYDLESYKAEEIAGELKGVFKQKVQNKCDFTYEFGPLFQLDGLSVGNFNALSIQDSWGKKSLDLVNDTFTNIDNTKSKIKFIKKDIISKSYYESDDFFIYSINLTHTNLYYIVPKEGKAISDINIENLDLFNLQFEKSPKTLETTFLLPKFDTTDNNLEFVCDLDLNYLKRHPLCKNFQDKIFLERDNRIGFFVQDCTFSIDENGIKGTAVTITAQKGSSAEIEEYETIKIDKPFYLVSTFYQIPLFTLKVINL